jgi:hypothetical protein
MPIEVEEAGREDHESIVHEGNRTFIRVLLIKVNWSYPSGTPGGGF